MPGLIFLFCSSPEVVGGIGSGKDLRTAEHLGRDPLSCDLD